MTFKIQRSIFQKLLILWIIIKVVKEILDYLMNNYQLKIVLNYKK